MRPLIFAPICLIATALFAGTVPFDPTRGIVEVDVTLNGTIKGKFGLDTGADRLYVDKTFAIENGLKLRKRSERRVVGLEGSSETAAIDVRSFALAGGTLHNITATSIDIGQLVKDKRFGIPDGLIGHEILQRYYVTVDYDERELELDMAEPTFISDEETDWIPFTLRRHFVLVDAVINDTIDVRLILDYCASFTVISQELAELLDLTPDKRGLVLVDRVTVGEKLESEDVRAVVDDVSAFSERTAGLPFDGILGANMLFRHRITVDYKRERIHIHR